MIIARLTGQQSVASEPKTDDASEPEADDALEPKAGCKKPSEKANDGDNAEQKPTRSQKPVKPTAAGTQKKKLKAKTRTNKVLTKEAMSTESNVLEEKNQIVSDPENGVLFVTQSIKEPPQAAPKDAISSATTSTEDVPTNMGLVLAKPGQLGLKKRLNKKRPNRQEISSENGDAATLKKARKSTNAKVLQSARKLRNGKIRQ